MFWLDSSKGCWYKVILLKLTQIYCLPVIVKVIYWYSIEFSVIECIWYISKYFNKDTVILVSYIKGLTIESIVVPCF